jgi:hypothetical protein
MNNVTKKPVKHVTRAKRDASEMDGEDMKIRFSPQVLEALQDLHSLVLGKHEKFDDDVAHILQSLAYGDQNNVHNTLLYLSLISEKAGEYVAKTRDGKVSSALQRLRNELGDFRSYDGQPVTLVAQAKGKSR